MDKLLTPDEFSLLIPYPELDDEAISHNECVDAYRALYSRMEAAERVCQVGLRFKRGESQAAELLDALAEWEKSR